MFLGKLIGENFLISFMSSKKHERYVDVLLYRCVLVTGSAFGKTIENCVLDKRLFGDFLCHNMSPWCLLDCLNFLDLGIKIIERFDFSSLYLWLAGCSLP